MPRTEAQLDEERQVRVAQGAGDGHGKAQAHHVQQPQRRDNRVGGTTAYTGRRLVAKASGGLHEEGGQAHLARADLPVHTW